MGLSVRREPYSPGFRADHRGPAGSARECAGLDLLFPICCLLHFTPFLYFSRSLLHFFLCAQPCEEREPRTTCSGNPSLSEVRGPQPTSSGPTHALSGLEGLHWLGLRPARGASCGRGGGEAGSCDLVCAGATAGVRPGCRSEAGEAGSVCTLTHTGSG